MISFARGPMLSRMTDSCLVTRVVGLCIVKTSEVPRKIPIICGVREKQKTDPLKFGPIFHKKSVASILHSREHAS